jgi:hypothetical protein
MTDAIPLSVLKLVKHIDSILSIMVNAQVKPLTEIYHIHSGKRATTTIKFIACSQQGLIKHSSNELVRK